MRKTAVVFILALMVLAGVRLAAQGAVVRGVLLTDASADESTLWVNRTSQVAVDALITVESRDGSYRGVYEVKHVFDGHILLKSPLTEDYAAGSKILQ